MTAPVAFTLAFDIAVHDPSPVLEAAARKFFRWRHAAPRPSKLGPSSPATCRRRS